MTKPDNIERDYKIVPTTNRPAFRFRGTLVAAASSWRKGDYMWTVLKAYATVGGKWVVEKIGEVEPENKASRIVDVLVFGSEEEMTAKLGSGRLAEKLYSRLGFEEITIR